MREKHDCPCCSVVSAYALIVVKRKSSAFAVRLRGANRRNVIVVCCCVADDLMITTHDHVTKLDAGRTAPGTSSRAHHPTGI